MFPQSLAVMQQYFKTKIGLCSIYYQQLLRMSRSLAAALTLLLCLQRLAAACSEAMPMQSTPSTTRSYANSFISFNMTVLLAYRQ